MIELRDLTLTKSRRGPAGGGGDRLRIKGEEGMRITSLLRLLIVSAAVTLFVCLRPQTPRVRRRRAASPTARTAGSSATTEPSAALQKPAWAKDRNPPRVERSPTPSAPPAALTFSGKRSFLPATNRIGPFWRMFAAKQFVKAPRSPWWEILDYHMVASALPFGSPAR